MSDERITPQGQLSHPPARHKSNPVRRILVVDDDSIIRKQSMPELNPNRAEIKIDWRGGAVEMIKIRHRPLPMLVSRLNFSLAGRPEYEHQRDSNAPNRTVFCFSHARQAT